MSRKRNDEVVRFLIIVCIVLASVLVVSILYVIRKNMAQKTDHASVITTAVPAAGTPAAEKTPAVRSVPETEKVPETAKADRGTHAEGETYAVVIPAPYAEVPADKKTDTAAAKRITAAETASAPAGKFSDLSGIAAGTEISPDRLDFSDIGRYFTISEIREGDAVFQRINGKSYRKNDNIRLSDLRYLLLPHYNFSGNIQVGELIVNRNIAEDVRSIFMELFSEKYQIEKMHLVDDYWTGNADSTDSNSIEHNNTSAFNYRAATGSSNLSQHAYGRAIDLNPQQNPYVSYSSGKAKWDHANANAYIDRTGGKDHVITHEDIAFRIFSAHGYTWGGDWNTIKDYQHFERKQE